MIKLDCVNNLEDYGLLLQDGVLNINKTIEEPIYVDKSININVLADAFIVFVTKSSDVLVNIAENVNLKCHMLYTNNSNYKFINSGSLEVMQISTNCTEENFVCQLVKENASCNVEVLALGASCKMNFVQNIVHKAMSSYSNISNFGVAVNGTDIMFDTSGKIEQGMAKSICKQLSKGIIMDDDSAVTSKPILLIDEYDVVANHGASIGKISDESLFYLMSRGLTKTEAFLLILDGIIRPFIDKIVDVELKTAIENDVKSLIKR